MAPAETGNGSANGVVAAAKPSLTKGSSKFGCFYQVTKSSRTHVDMLVARTSNRDTNQPDANDDNLAARFRDECAPKSFTWFYNHWPGAKASVRRSLENPLWGVPGFVNFIDSRTKWFDGAVSDALRSGVTQVVILAAGFDTRPYRFASPGVSFYEVDLPAASARKRALVDKLGLLAEQPAAERHPPPTFVAADLSVTDLEQALAESPATAAGARRFDPSQRTLFTAEGLLYYLPPAAVHALLASVSRCAAPGSALYFDFMNRDALEGRRAYPSFSTVAKAVANKGEPFLSGLEPSTEALSELLLPLGFSVTSVLGGRQMMAAMLPRVEWSDRRPPTHAFYSYASAVKK